MSVREKIIVGIMFAALAVGAFFLLRPKSMEQIDLRPDTIKKHLEEVTQFVDTAKQTVNQEIAGQVDAPYVVMRAKTKWPSDPFLDRAVASAFEAEKIKTESPELTDKDLGLVYTGYLIAGSRILAIINGVEYEVGDKLQREGDYVIRSVSQTEVVIGREGSTLKVVIPLEDTGL
ncbi:MAG: hypothetical protein HQK55_03395 [Deltaproteobacteria bacterium]|nr:hypothetical protein [Deltaproteobacteria bacterium]